MRAMTIMIRTTARLALALGAALAMTCSTVVRPGSMRTLKLAVGQRGNWDTSISELGTRAGIFKKHGLTLELLYTQGSAETTQAVISGSVDIGVGSGIMGVLGAFAKNAPVRVLGAETTGAADLYWYVRADSPIKTLKDTDGKTIAFSGKGSSTDGIVTAFMKQYDLKAKPTATGGPPATLTQVMSGQIDVGWSAPPFGLEQLDKGEIRIIASGNDAAVFKGQTVTAPCRQHADAAEPQGRARPLHAGLPRDHRLDVFRPGGDPAVCRVAENSRVRSPGARATVSSPRRRSIPTGSWVSIPSSRTPWSSNTPPRP